MQVCDERHHFSQRLVCGGITLLLGLALGCSGPAGPLRYRLTGSGNGWYVAGSDPVLEDVRPIYPEIFEIILTSKDYLDLAKLNFRELRDDLEREPVGRGNYDALNAAAIAYFELNARAEADRQGSFFLQNSQFAAQVAAISWKAYGEIQDGALRDAILDFFADATSGEKMHSSRTRFRLRRVVLSLAKKEEDPGRLHRIKAIAAQVKRSTEEL